MKIVVCKLRMGNINFVELVPIFRDWSNLAEDFVEKICIICKISERIDPRFVIPQKFKQRK